MIKAQDKPSRELYLEAIKKTPSKTRLATLKKEATWHTKTIVERLEEIEE